MGEVDLGALVVEDRGLDRALQELVGVAAEELVQGVLPGDVHRQAPPAPPGAPPHLAQRGDGAGEGDDHRGVELADVDPELQRVGGDHRAQLAPHQTALQLAPLLGGVAGAVGDHEVGESPPPRSRPLPVFSRPPRRPPDSSRSPSAPLRSRSLPARAPPAPAGESSSTPLRDFMKQIARAPSRTSRASSSAASPSAERRAPSAASVSGGFHIAILPPRRRGAVLVDQPDPLQTSEPLRELARVGDRRGGEQEARRGAVGGGDAAQAAHHVGDVGAEHAAVDVRLVDHDDGEVGEEAWPTIRGGEGSRGGACRGW